MIEQFISNFHEACDRLRTCVICSSLKPTDRRLIFPKGVLAKLTNNRPIAYAVCDSCGEDSDAEKKAKNIIAVDLCKPFPIPGVIE